MKPEFTFLRLRRVPTLGLLVLVVLAGVAAVPIKDLVLQSDLDAGGYDLDNVTDVYAAGTVSAAGSVASGTIDTTTIRAQGDSNDRITLDGTDVDIQLGGATEATIATSGLTVADIIESGGRLRATGLTAPTSGAGTEVYYDAANNRGALIAYDRTGGSYKDLMIAADSEILWNLNGSTRARMTTLGLDMEGRDVVDAGEIDVSDGIKIATAAPIDHDGAGLDTIKFWDTQTVFTQNGLETLRFADSPARIIFNEGGNNLDLKVESDTNPNLFFLDGGLDAIGIGAVPSGTYGFEVASTVAAAFNATTYFHNDIKGEVTTDWNILYGDSTSSIDIGGYFDQGGRILLKGNTSASSAGDIVLDAGSATDSDVRIRDAGSEVARFSSTEGMVVSELSHFGDRMRVYGIGAHTSGKGTEIFYNSGANYGGMSAYDRDASAYKALWFNATSVKLRTGAATASDRVIVTDTGTTFSGDIILAEGETLQNGGNAQDNIGFNSNNSVWKQNNIDRIRIWDSGASGTVINETGADIDFRVEGDTETSLLRVDASTDRIGIGTATPDELLDVAGDAIVDGELSSLVPVNAYGQARTLTLGECMRGVVPVSGECTITLPNIDVAGRQVTIVAQGYYVTVDPDSSDYIKEGGDTYDVGHYIKSAGTVQGEILTLTSISTTTWQITQISGTWTEEP